MTVQLSFMAMLLGLLLAVVCAWGKTAGPAPVRWLINIYIEIIRNTPFLIQLFFFFFAFPAAGVRLSPYTAAFVALVFNLGAYATEIVRAGIIRKSVGSGKIGVGRLDLGGRRFI